MTEPNPGMQAVLNNAIQAHQAGQLAEAEAAYRQVLEAAPDHPVALHLLGVIAMQTGNNDEAVDLITRALTLNSGLTEAHNNLGLALHALGRFEDAVTSFGKALSLNPGYAMAHNNLANTLMETGQLDAAVAGFQKTVALTPGDAQAHNNLANALRQRGRLEDAAEHFRKAIALDPGNPGMHNNLGNTLRDQEHLEEAAASYRKAIALDPEYAEAHYNLGNALKELDQLNDALTSYQKALALNPGYAPAHNNMGVLHRELGRMEDAAACYRQAFALDPDYAEARLNLSHLQLLMGDYENGWQGYGWRWKVDEFTSPYRELDAPVWQGEPIDGKRLLVWPEQGIGDEILFAGMVPELIERGIELVLESDKRLAPLFSRSFPSVSCIARDDPALRSSLPESIDIHIPMGGLGRILRPTLEDFPEPAPYLVADPEQKSLLRHRYQALGHGPLIGVAWRSFSSNAGEQRSLTLTDLLPLLKNPGVTFIDLQYGDTGEERLAFTNETGIEIIHDGQVDQMADLDAFAAQIAALDMILSIDNSTVLIAGALGIPTWVMLSTVPYWSWGLAREDSPWLASLRLFRQQHRGAWSSAINRAAREFSETFPTRA